MELVGYISSLLIGFTLGLIGSGGSILTVPVLVYLFSVDALAASSYSLFIVGLTSAIGSIEYFRSGLVNIRMAIVFGAPSIITVFLTRAYILPAMPNEIIAFGSFHITKSIFIMLLFALLMIAASYSMIKKEKEKKEKTGIAPKFNFFLILLEGAAVGLVTGIVGAGGGFLIIPTLVLLSKLSMKEAVGTSLVIIAAKSLIGFWGEGSDTIIDWNLIATVSVIAIIGIFIGIYFSKKIDGNKLKPIFGWFVLILGVFIIIKETILR